VAGLGGLLFTVGCGTSQTGFAAAAAPANVSQPGTPIVVGCEPNQRTLVRPSVVNGVAVSQIECVSVAEIAASTPIAQQSGFVPVSYRPAAIRDTKRGSWRHADHSRVVSGNGRAAGACTAGRV
jgi:hypothetical protein